ncbi:MAG TPA: hypothetical protein VLA19_10480 [Herpetosiphonaceae bacterium]|nr:hypothetical protein [Herpetosiphonaceae bacterium]
MTPGLLRTDAAPSQHGDGDTITIPQAVYDAAAAELAAAQQLWAAQERHRAAQEQHLAELDRQIAELNVERGKQLALHEILHNCINDRSISQRVRARRIRIIRKYARHLLEEVRS